MSTQSKNLIKNVFINTKKAFKMLYMFYFQMFQNSLNTSLVKKMQQH